MATLAATEEIQVQDAKEIREFLKIHDSKIEFNQKNPHSENS